MAEETMDQKLSKLYEDLGRCLYKHGMLELELETTSNQIQTLRTEIHLLETKK